MLSKQEKEHHETITDKKIYELICMLHYKTYNEINFIVPNIIFTLPLQNKEFDDVFNFNFTLDYNSCDMINKFLIVGKKIKKVKFKFLNKRSKIIIKEYNNENVIIIDDIFLNMLNYVLYTQYITIEAKKIESVKLNGIFLDNRKFEYEN